MRRRALERESADGEPARQNSESRKGMRMNTATLSAIGFPEIVALVVILVLVASLVGLFLQLSKYKKAHRQADSITDEARREAERVVKDGELEARDKALQARDKFQKETEATRQELKNTERRLEKREDSLAEQAELQVRKEKTIESTNYSNYTNEEAS